MAEQYMVITTGELNASIEDFGEFTTKEVEFIGSDDDPDFLLQGANSERGFIFYLPKYESKKYSLHPGSVAKAFYEVGGRLYGEVEEGFIKVTVTKPEAVVIEFEVSVKESAGGTTIHLTGSGTFKGRVPWANRYRELLNIAQGGAPFWLEGPDILQPKPGVVSPGFRVVGRTGIAKPDDWELEILIGPTVVHRNKGQSGREFSYDVPANLIPVGTGFYFRLDYYIWPLWSKWTYSGDLVAGVGEPQIFEPADGSTAVSRPLVRGSGYPGATVYLYKAGSGSVVHGSAFVEYPGRWETTPTVAFGLGNFPLTANQVFNGVTSGYSENVNLQIVSTPPLVVTYPKSGQNFYFVAEVQGTGTPGATVRLYRHGDSVNVLRVAIVEGDGTWTTKHGTPLPLGELTFTAKETLGGVDSGWAEVVSIKVVLLPTS